MKNDKLKKIIVICGPTASGKSNVAIQLAKKFDGEIISADSRQIYKGMDIGTGKVIKDKTTDNHLSATDHRYVSEGITHHLIDVVDPNEDFNVSHFKKLSEKAIEDILQRGKLPIICGGTGFWIDAVVNNSQIPAVAPNAKLREKLAQKSAAELFAQLEKLDPERAKAIDKNNPVRLIRAIEICEALGKVPKLQTSTCHPVRQPADSGSKAPHNSEILKQVQHDKDKYRFLQIGIDVSREILNKKIKKRLDERFEQDMIQEVANLHNSPAGEGVSWQRLEAFGLEYRWIARYLQNQISLKNMQEKLNFDIIHYAKRQMTWFKRNKKIIWCENYEQIEKEVEKFL